MPIRPTARGTKVTSGVAGLVFGSSLIWSLLAVPAWRLWGDGVLLQSFVALAICLVPAVGTLVWSRRAAQQSPEQQMLATLGGKGNRLLFAIGAGIGLYLGVPALHYPWFLVWVVIFYLVTLTLEVSIVLKGGSGDGKSHS